MSKNVKRGLVSIVGGLGVIVLLLGIFTDVYSFGIGLVIAIALWIVSGVMATMLGVKEEKK